MHRSLSQSALVSTSTASASPPRPRSPAAFCHGSNAAAAAAASTSSASAAFYSSSTRSRSRGPRLCVSASSAVASPPPPSAASSSSIPSMMGTSGSDLGEVTAIHGPEELDAVLASSAPGHVVVLMAKSAGCRPCKAFGRKFARIAALYGGGSGGDGSGGSGGDGKGAATFLVVTGDESKETRAMMMAMKVRVTPTFFIYKDGALFKTTTGVNENNLKAAIDEAGGRAGGGGGGGGGVAAEAAAA